jgi:hypothetical protein
MNARCGHRVTRVRLSMRKANKDKEEQTMRLKIPGGEEIDALFGRPRFRQEERDEYCSLATQEKTALKQPA